jgi:hypothetical protein
MMDYNKNKNSFSDAVRLIRLRQFSGLAVNRAGVISQSIETSTCVTGSLLYLVRFAALLCWFVLLEMDAR